MTTAKKLSYQIMRLLNNGSRPKDSSLNEDYIMTEVRQVCHKLIRGTYFEQKNAGEHDVNHLYIATYSNCEVQEDEDKQRCYIDLPAIPMHLPGNVGIQKVSPQTGDPSIDVAMIPIMPNEVELFRSLNAGFETMKDQFCFEPARDKIWFTEADEESLLDAGVENVEVQMVVIDPAQVGANDWLPIPPEMELDVIKEVLVLHGYTGKEVTDLINDNAPIR